MARIKEIWCMPHSHLDIGYTHPQPMLLELQVDYLQQALELCWNTRDYPEGSRFCWTVEANYVLKRWLKTASPADIDLLKEMIRRGQVCITAQPFHATPCANANEMVHMLSELEQLRDLLETDIKVAINHDVNGQPWPLGQLLLDSGVDFYLTGINIHFGGVPFVRPAAFQWEMADGRRLQTYLGEHYSLFSQYLYTQEHSLERMQEGALEYAKWLEDLGYGEDYAFLTATNPPLYDNNCPDAELPDLIRRYNEEGHEFRLRLVTAEDLRRRVLVDRTQNMPVYRGDWTDYWNFGCGSTARETRVSRLGRNTLEQSEVIECFRLERNSHLQQAKTDCYDSALVFEEHTWGASQSVTDPHCPETYSQLVHKIKKAYEAADLGAYLLGSAMERYNRNPHQSNSLEGVTLINTSAYPQTVELEVPADFCEPWRQLAALRIKGYASYMDAKAQTKNMGLVTLPPFTGKTFPFAELAEGKNTAGYTLTDGELITPYYRVQFDSQTGAVTQVQNKNGKPILDESRGYALFEPVRETVDVDKNEPCRKTLFPRNVDLGNHSITQWNHDWHSKRESGRRMEAEVIRETNRVRIVSRIQLPGTASMEQTVTFYTYQPKISMHVTFLKEGVYEPESIYFAVPLKMQEGWQCSYDTAGQFAQLDTEQIGNVCRDWVTVDTNVSVYDSQGCVTLACPDAPLVQVGEFGFGRESRQIQRDADPLLLGWAMNNYWDTNFCADQAGTVTFGYELTWHESFCPEQALADGISARKPCVLGAAVKAEAVQQTMLCCEGSSKALHVFPQEDYRAICVLLTNPAQETDQLMLSLPGKTLVAAQIISASGKVLEEGCVEENAAFFRIPAKAVKLVRLQVQA